MNTPTISDKQELYSIKENSSTIVAIPGTRRTVKIRWIKPGTLECLTRLWLERDMAIADSSADTLKDLCIEPYFAVKEACMFVLNSYIGIKLIYPIMWRIWGKVIGYTDEQMLPIIESGKKKLPLMSHWQVMAYSVDMRTDWMKMTKREAEQYQAELLSVAKLHSAKNSPNTDAPNGA